VRGYAAYGGTNHHVAVQTMTVRDMLVDLREAMPEYPNAAQVRMIEVLKELERRLPQEVLDKR
jgi:hypothetical protein